MERNKIPKYLKKKKLYAIAKSLIKEEIPLCKDCNYSFYRGSERLSCRSTVLIDGKPRFSSDRPVGNYPVFHYGKDYGGSGRRADRGHTAPCGGD